MSKYIRTKDGIYEILKEHKLPVGNDVYYITNHKNFYSYEVIDKADTIEELCDEFVYIDEGCYPEISDELDLMQTKSTIIYGAIWTEWGLKYVARMNEKGVLELL